MRQALNMGAAAAGFAHLLGFPAKPASAAGAAAAEDDEDKKDPDAEDEDKDPSAEEDDETKPADGKKGRKAKKAESDDDKDPDAEGDDCDPDAEEDEEKDPEARAAFRRGRAAERKRCAAIFGSAAAGARPDMAAQLAFTTSLPVAQALPLLNASATTAGAPTTGRLGHRMAALNVPKPGGDAPAGKSDGSGAAGLAAQIVAAGKKRRGEKV